MKVRYFRSREGWIRRVPATFSWTAFFLGPTWAFANRAWLLGIVGVAAELPVEFLSRLGREKSPGLFIAAALTPWAFMFVSGRYGNRWLAWSLRRQGYMEIQQDAV